MKVDVLAGWTGLDEKRWNGLLDRSKLPSVFLSWQWQTQWAQAFARDRRLHLLSVTDEEGGLTGLLPLYEEQPATLRFLGGVDVSDYLDVIVAAGREEEVWHALLQHRAAEPRARPRARLRPPGLDHRRGTLPRAPVAGDLGRLPRPPLGEGPARAAPQDAQARARAAGGHRALPPRARGLGRGAEPVPQAPPPLQGRQGALHGRADGAVLPRCDRRPRRGRVGAPLVSRVRGRGGGELPLSRIRGDGGALQLRLRPGSCWARPGHRAAGPRDQGRHRSRHPDLRLPPR